MIRTKIEGELRKQVIATQVRRSEEMELMELISLWQGDAGWEVSAMVDRMEKEASKQTTQENLADWTTLRADEFKSNQIGCQV